MATQIYNYNMVASWHMDVSYEPTWNTEAQAIADLIHAVETTTENQFVTQMVKAGHWYKVDSVSTEGAITKVWSRNVGGNSIPAFTYTAKTTLNFDSDIKDPLAHGSPQLLEIIGFTILGIVAFIEANAAVILLVCALLAFALVLQQLANVTTGVVAFEKTIGGTVATIIGAAVIGIVAIIGLQAYFGKKKPKRRR